MQSQSDETDRGAQSLSVNEIENSNNFSFSSNGIPEENDSCNSVSNSSRTAFKPGNSFSEIAYDRMRFIICDSPSDEKALDYVKVGFLNCFNAASGV